MPSHRTRSFRRSVVQVVAAFSPVITSGCDFSKTEVIHNPPACQPYPACAAVPECPVELPEAAAACEDPGEDCAYETGVARCIDDKWQVEDEVEAKCPEEPVKIWDECSLPEGTRCAADDECNPLVACSEGRWGGDGKLLICNPPEPECPPEAPLDQSDCNYAGPACSYPEGLSAECKDYKWQLTQPCPGDLPTAGQECVPTKEACGYHDCYGFPQFMAECIEQAWVIGEMSCNPPATE